MADPAMATRTEVLQGRLAVDTSAWRTGLAQASTMFKSFTSSIGRGLSSAFSSSLGSIKGTLSSIGGMISSTIGGALQALGIGGLLSTGGILAGIKNVADLGGEISDVSARTGIAADQLVILREQFRQGGIEAGSVTQYIRRMNEALMDGKKQNLFKALGLDAKRLLAGGPVEALNAIIDSIRGLSTAAQQGVLSKIFGGRQGINLMTLVVDEGSAEKAKSMIGSLSAIIKKNMDDFDTISDNLFGGIPIKMQQFFAGFLEAVSKPFLQLTELVTNADFSRTGGSLGDALIWAWNMFSQLVKSGDLWEYIGMKLQHAFLSSLAILSAGIRAAFSSFFSEANINNFLNFFGGLGKVIGNSIAEALPSWIGGGVSDARTQAKADGRKEMTDALLNVPTQAMDSLKNFATELGNWKADTAFAPVLENLERNMFMMRFFNAAPNGFSPNAPAIVGPSFRPGSTAPSIFNQVPEAESARKANETAIWKEIAKNTAATAEAAEEWAIE